ncbi:MFS transporter [Amycolatopsis sp. cg5]|uniref:MFS transporter n=1 Tax=Amycolatopsis sp. cg5 TaxID=3238802 RepID=UPI00352660B3
MVTETTSRQPAATTVLLTAAMAFSMLPLFLLGALAPALVAEFGIGRPMLGVLVTAGFGVAAVLSLVIGQVVDALGARRCATALFGISTVTLTVFALAPHYLVLVLTVALGGIPQALANPATNKIIGRSVPAPRRALVIGVKQSGVQLGAFAAGLPLAGLASWLDWRLAVGIAAACAAVATVASLRLPADPAPARRPGLRVAFTAEPAIWWLLAFSVPLGAGIAAVNTYAALYATQELHWGAQTAGALVAALGVTGIAGRIGWSRLVSGGRAPTKILGPLTAGAVAATGALLAARQFGWAWAWLGVLGVGAFAVAANAVSMMAVMAMSTPDQTGRNSALVSAGFFGGFALGPPCFGLLADLGGYPAGWALVAAEFAVAALVAWRGARR